MFSSKGSSDCGLRLRIAGCGWPSREGPAVWENIYISLHLRVPQTAGCDCGLRAADGPPREICIPPGSDCGLRAANTGCGWPSREGPAVLVIRLRATDTGCGLRMGVQKRARSLLSTYSRRCEAADLDCGLRQSQATKKSCRVSSLGGTQRVTLFRGYMVAFALYSSH